MDGLRELRNIAIASALHPRLGKDSPLLGLPADLISKIVAHGTDNWGEIIHEFRPNGYSVIEYSWEIERERCTEGLVPLDWHIDCREDDIATIEDTVLPTLFDTITPCAKNLVALHGKGGDRDCMDGNYAWCPITENSYWAKVEFRIGTLGSRRFSIMRADLHYEYDVMVGPRSIFPDSVTRFSVCPLSQSDRKKTRRGEMLD